MFLIFQVSVLCNLFNESRSDRQSKEVLGEITDYNKRYSGAPRRVSTISNLQQTHLFLTLNERSLLSVPVWLYKSISWCAVPLLIHHSIVEKMRIPPLFPLIMCFITGVSLMQPQGFIVLHNQP